MTEAVIDRLGVIVACMNNKSYKDSRLAVIEAVEGDREFRDVDINHWIQVIRQL